MKAPCGGICKSMAPWTGLRACAPLALLLCLCGIAAVSGQDVRLVGRFVPGPDDRPAKLPQVR